MDNDDKLIESMFDEVVETHVKLVDGKHVVVTDEETIAQMDASAMAEAVNDFGFWAKKFRDSNGGDPRHGRANGWWVNLQWLALADAKLKDLFCGRDRSPESIKRYHAYRLQLIEGGSSKADA
jgi:hypothetical protein